MQLDLDVVVTVESGRDWRHGESGQPQAPARKARPRDTSRGEAIQVGVSMARRDDFPSPKFMNSRGAEEGLRLDGAWANGREEGQELARGRRLTGERGGVVTQP